MDLERFCFEVPVINLIKVTRTNISNETEDQDSKEQQKNINNNNNASSTHIDKNKDTLIVIDDDIDDDRDNDCTIIDDQNDSEENQARPNNTNMCKLHNTDKVCNIIQSKNIENNINNAPTIDVDDDTDCENDCSIVDTNTDSNKNSSNNTHKNNGVNQIDEIYRQNKLLAEIIEKCLDMENSMGMLRIINRTLIPIYNDTSPDFKKSDHFKKSLERTLNKLETVPNSKFMHLKELCEVMKSGRNNLYGDDHNKRRVELTTLKRNLNGKFSTNEIKSSNSTIPKKKTKVHVIDVDDDDDHGRIVSNNETGIQISEVRCQAFEGTSVQNANIHNNDIGTTEINNEVVTNRSSNENEHSKIDDDVVLIEDSSNSNKENVTIVKNTSAPNVPVGKQAKKASNIPSNYTHNNEEIENINKSTKSGEIQSPQMSLIEHDKIKQIANLEIQIQTYYSIIKDLDEREVDWNHLENAYNPYVESQFYKNKVVELYKELCQLTGSEAVKRRRVRLKVATGRPEGPVRCLEKFINDNIDEDGNPPFPDMQDVIDCVSKANVKHQLGWPKKQIDKEARALFVHYGRTVQKSRQKREWRHLMRYVKTEAVDPAEEDPTLQARLQANAKLAVKNEMDLLDRYVQMENSNSIAGTNIESSESDHDVDSGETSTARSETVFNHDNVPANATALNYQDLYNNGINNKESNSNQVTNNTVVYNPSNSTVPLYIPTIAPMKYLVIDENMRPVGVVTNLPTNCGVQLKHVDFFEKGNADCLKDIQKDTNSINAIDSLNHNGSQELDVSQVGKQSNVEEIENTPIENNEVMPTNAVNERNVQFIKDSFENTEAYIEMNIKPDIIDIEDSFSIQYNEISTNTDADINTDIVEDQCALENNEVSSSSEVCATTGDFVNDMVVSSEITVYTSVFVDDTRPSEVGDKIFEIAKDAGSEKKREDNFTPVNNTKSSEIEDKTREHVNNIESTENVNNTPKVVNDAGSSEIGLEPSKVVDDSRSSETLNNTCELVNDTESAETSDKTGLANHKESPNADFNEIVIKQEKPEDIPLLLEALGDNFTVSIIDIEDPFEIIEISDSSDSEDDL